MCFIEWYHCRLPLISFEGPFSSIKRFQGQYVKKKLSMSHMRSEFRRRLKPLFSSCINTEMGVSMWSRI